MSAVLLGELVQLDGSFHDLLESTDSTSPQPSIRALARELHRLPSADPSHRRTRFDTWCLVPRSSESVKKKTGNSKPYTGVTFRSVVDRCEHPAMLNTDDNVPLIRG